MLVVTHLSKKFGDHTVLHDVSFTVKRGEIAVFLGHSGVGKSTLLRILNNLEQPDSGGITLDNKKLDLTTINNTHLVGMVFQHFNLFEHLTVEKNITLALEKIMHKSSAEARESAQNLLRHYGLETKANKYPHQLSGGQKQRLAIARAVAMRPHIMCLDEPTSALDPVLTSHIAETIQHLAKEGYIVLVATHDISLLRKLTCTIYLMQGGSIVETASSEKVESHPAQFSHITRFIAGNK